MIIEILGPLTASSQVAQVPFEFQFDSEQLFSEYNGSCQSLAQVSKA